MIKILILMILALKVLAEKKYDFNLEFFQNDYHIVPEWFEVIRYDKKYVKELSAVVHKYNRTVAVMNLTFSYTVDLGNRLEIVAQMYRFASNEYREFPVRMEANFCQAIEQDFFGAAKMLTCGNFTGCPIHKGRKYHVCNWVCDESKLPPYFPSGRYMTEWQGMYDSVEIFLCRAYGAVTRPEIVRKTN